MEGEEARVLAARISGPFAASPAAWAVPADLEDLQRLVRHAALRGAPLIPRGGGTGMPGGNLGTGIVVSLAEAFRERGPVRIHPDGSATLRVGAGVVAAAADDAARQRGFHLPFLPSSAPWATVGGMVATNAAGARTFGYGAAAAWVVSVEGVLADGRHVGLGRSETPASPGGGTQSHETEEIRTRSGWSWNPPDLLRGLDAALPSALPHGWPRGLRKNSSGYGLDRWLASGDPAQLLVGSEGTLALVTHLTFRLAPVPAAQGVVLVPVADSRQAAALSVAAADLGATACEFLGRRLLDMAGLDLDPELGSLTRGAWALFLLEFEGDSEPHLASVLDGVGAGLRTAFGTGRLLATPDPLRASRLWRLRHRASPLISDLASQGLISTQFIEDSVVPPAELGRYLDGLEEILAGGSPGTRTAPLGAAARRPAIDAVVFGHAGDGNVHVNPLVNLSEPGWQEHVRGVLDEVVELVAGLGGTLAGEHGDGRLRAPFLERVWGTEATAAFRALKATFDPEGMLNPGVILALPGQDPLEALAPRPRDWPAIATADPTSENPPART